MFSARLDWDLRPNRLSAALQAKRRAGACLIDLTESNPTRAGIAYPEDEVLGALADPRSVLYEPSPAGALSARLAIAERHSEPGRPLDPDRILLTASTSEAYSYCFKLLADPGSEILAPRPSYPLFDYLAALESVRIVQYPLAYHGAWRIDFDALASAVSPRTRAIVVVNPNNPTGSFLNRDELERLTAFAAAHELAIISDEVFSEYAFAPDPRRVGSLADSEGALVFCLSGLSKLAGLPQMKLGWILVGGPATLRANAVERLELIADTYLSVGTPVQHATARLLAAGARVRQRILERARENLGCLRAAVAGSPEFEVLNVEGGWYAVLRVPRTRGEEEWALALLEEADVLAQPGFFYDFESEAYLVLSLLTPSEDFTEGARRILAMR